MSAQTALQIALLCSSDNQNEWQFDVHFILISTSLEVMVSKVLCKFDVISKLDVHLTFVVVVSSVP